MADLLVLLRGKHTQRQRQRQGSGRQYKSMVKLENGGGSIFKRHHRLALHDS